MHFGSSAIDTQENFGKAYKMGNRIACFIGVPLRQKGTSQYKTHKMHKPVHHSGTESPAVHSQLDDRHRYQWSST